MFAFFARAHNLERITPERAFVDRQLRGPYRVRAFVARDLERIFDFRHATVARLLG